MRAPLPLISAIGLLVAAGMLATRPYLAAGAGALVLIGVAAVLLLDRDRQLAGEIIDGTLDLIHSAARPIKDGEPR